MPARTPHAHRSGRHERGENLLVCRRTVAAVVDEVASWPPAPIVEYAAGRGALTLPLAELGRPVTAVEVDERLAAALRRRAGGRVHVEVADMLAHPLPAGAAVVSSVPFHLTTPWLRRLLADGGWSHALLLLQWEVARKRAGVGGATLMTARWWPWYDFALLRRVPARAFRPVPSVDGGLLRIRRRPRPLLDERARGAYQRFVARTFGGPGRGVAAIVARGARRRGAASWMRRNGIDPRALPRDLTAGEWVALFEWLRDGGR